MSIKLVAGLLACIGIGALASCSDQEAPTGPKPTFDVTAPEDASEGIATLGPEVQVLQDEVPDGSDTPCTTAMTGTFDNVVVPPGAFCGLTNATVRGNVKALQDAVLVITLNTTVGGSVYADKADALQIRNATIQGNIEMVEGGPHPFYREVAICGTTLPNGTIKIIKVTAEGTPPVSGIDLSPTAGCLPPTPNNVAKGNLQIEDNLLLGTAFLSITNIVMQNLQVYKTGGLTGPKTVVGNTVGESIQCFENDEPFVGSPNEAKKSEGQCMPVPPPPLPTT